MNALPSTLRARPALLRALGAHEPPRTVTVDGSDYELEEVFKHDSWAATGLYGGTRGKIVVKFNREYSFLGWLGYLLARREARALRRLRGMAGVPEDAGPVFTSGRRRHCAVAHFYLEGHPLHIDERPADDFFARLENIVTEMHRRSLAYVDLNKRENILVLDDGTPALVDFQLHYNPPRWVLYLPFVRGIFDQARLADRYHLRKHMAWHRPDLLPAGEKAKLPLTVRVWRVVFVRLLQPLRRRLLVRMRVRDKGGRAVGELYPEKAAQLTLERKAREPAARLPGQI